MKRKKNTIISKRLTFKKYQIKISLGSNEGWKMRDFNEWNRKEGEIIFLIIYMFDSKEKRGGGIERF